MSQPTTHHPNRPRLAIETFTTGSTSALEESEPMVAPPLDFHALTVDGDREHLMQQWEQTTRSIQEATETSRREQLRKFCASITDELRKRHVPAVLQGEAEVHAQVKLTELSFDSLQGSTFEAEAIMGEWKTVVHGNSLEALSRQLAGQIATRYRAFKNPPTAPR